MIKFKGAMKDYMGEEEQINAQSAAIRSKNKGLIKIALHRLKTATRTELATDTNLSVAVITLLTNELLMEKEIVEKGYTQSSAGRKSMTYSLNREIACLLSVIVEINSMEYMITDLDGQVLDRRTVERNTAIRYFDHLVLLLQDLMEGNPKIASIGIGVPGAVTPQGRIFAIPQILELEECNLKIKLQDILHIPVAVKNDINITALGYYRKSVAFTLEEMVYIHIGGGLGSGVIIGGKLITGFTNFAGEIAYMQVGERKCIEEIILNPRRKKNRLTMVGKMITNIICLLNPSIIVIGGELASEMNPEKIETICKKVLPTGMLPIIRTIYDERKYYFEGLAECAMDTYCLPEAL